MNSRDVLLIAGLGVAGYLLYRWWTQQPSYLPVPNYPPLVGIPNAVNLPAALSPNLSNSVGLPPGFYN